MPETNLIQRPDLMLRLQQFFGLRQRTVVPTLGSVINPVVLVADLTQLRGLRSERGTTSRVVRCGGFMLTGQGIGLFTRALFRNPGGSDRVYRIRQISVEDVTSGGAVSHGFILQQTSNLANLQNTSILDTTFKPVDWAGVVNLASALMSWDTNAVGIAMQTWRQVATGLETRADVEEIAVLGENDAIAFNSVNTNVALRFNMLWDEEPPAD